MKNNIFTLVLSFTFFSSNCQEPIDMDSIAISIDWEVEMNKKHKYKSIYSQKNQDYLRWVYKTSKNVTGYTADGLNKAQYYHDGRGNDPIVFMVEENNEIRTETYRNAVLPSSRTRSKFSIDIPYFRAPRIEGSLPKGIVTYFSDSNKGYEMGIEIDNSDRKVKIEILDMNNDLVHIIEDKTLDKGWHKYKWDTSSLESGSYILKYTVDKSEMTQIIELEKGRGSIIHKLFDWIF